LWPPALDRDRAAGIGVLSGLVQEVGNYRVEPATNTTLSAGTIRAPGGWSSARKNAFGWGYS
jgi:hypothetical protein